MKAVRRVMFDLRVLLACVFLARILGFTRPWGESSAYGIRKDLPHAIREYSVSRNVYVAIGISGDWQCTTVRERKPKLFDERKPSEAAHEHAQSIVFSNFHKNVAYDTATLSRGCAVNPQHKCTTFHAQLHQVYVESFARTAISLKACTRGFFVTFQVVAKQRANKYVAAVFHFRCLNATWFCHSLFTRLTVNCISRRAPRPSVK